mmetsp:Transcript_67038/g.187455  ORF Transcript_67038/g.187455 Transcript_67038/m.187455 type:complete len:522 (-) Transcript_67038:400-1965(-)
MRALGLLPCMTFNCDSGPYHALSFGSTSGPRACGCGWSARTGCSVSAEQRVRDWEALPMGMPGCASVGPAHSDECALRRKIARLAASAPEEQALYQAVVKDIFRYSTANNNQGDSPDPVPTLIEAIILQSNCSGHDEESCDPRSCAWTPDSSQWRCHIRPIDAARLMREYAYALLDLKRAFFEARCRALHETPRGNGPPRCGSPCFMRRGTCALDRTKLQDPPVRTIMDQLCLEAEQNEIARLQKEQRKWEYRYEAVRNGVLNDDNARSQVERLNSRETCLSPCRRVRGVCSGDLSDTALRWGRSNETEHLVRAYALLMSATMLHEERCRDSGLSLPMACRATPPVCEDRHQGLWSRVAGGGAAAGAAGGGLLLLAAAVLGGVLIARRWVGRSKRSLQVEEVPMRPEQELVPRTVSMSAAPFTVSEMNPASGPGRGEQGATKAMTPGRLEPSAAKPFAGQARADQAPGASKPAAGAAPVPKLAAVGKTPTAPGKPTGPSWAVPAQPYNAARATDILRRGGG